MTVHTKPAPSRPAPTIPHCPRCRKQRVLYGGVCSRCLDDGDREDKAR